MTDMHDGAHLSPVDIHPILDFSSPGLDFADASSHSTLSHLHDANENLADTTTAEQHPQSPPALDEMQLQLGGHYIDAPVYDDQGYIVDHKEEYVDD